MHTIMLALAIGQFDADAPVDLYYIPAKVAVASSPKKKPVEVETPINTRVVNFHTIPNCEPCRQGKAALKKAGIPFNEINGGAQQYPTLVFIRADGVQQTLFGWPGIQTFLNFYNFNGRAVQAQPQVQQSNSNHYSISGDYNASREKIIAHLRANHRRCVRGKDLNSMDREALLSLHDRCHNEDDD